MTPELQELIRKARQRFEDEQRHSDEMARQLVMLAARKNLLAKSVKGSL